MVTARAARLARRALALLGRDWERFGGSLRGASGAIFGARPPRPGLAAYNLHPPGGTRRIHLRIDADGSGVLFVDVTDAIHLNATAAALARWALERVPVDRAIATLQARHCVADRGRIAQKSREVYALVEHLATTADACPTCGLPDLARTPLFSTPVRAPYKADLALSYGCNNACGHCYNPPERRRIEPLSLEGWRRVLRRLAAIGVPHVIFTGGEPTLVDHLPELVEAATRLGLVTGLNTNGRRLRDRTLADRLARAGLDHVQITLESCRADVHNAMTAADSFTDTLAGIENSLCAGLHTITNTTLTRQNIDHAGEVVDFLGDLGVRTFAMNGMIYAGRGRTGDDAVHEPEMAPVLVAVRDRAAQRGMRFLWYTPTAYCRLSPLELELGPRRCNAGQYSIAIEPNGDVLPCQSYYEPVGNILRDPWERIWESALFRSFRNRTADPRGCGLPEPCWECPDLPMCGGGCRLERERDCRTGFQPVQHHGMTPFAATRGSHLR
jgi:radical SAM protein with 4Fe4S-binding SPASM domain